MPEKRPPKRPPKRPLVSRFKLALAGILLLLVLILVVQNQETVSTEVLFWSVEAPRFALLGFVFLAGVLTGYLLGRSIHINVAR